MNIFRNSFSRTTTTINNRKPSPIDIPEILEHIFSHLDEYTLRKRVVFVCRLWYLLNRGRFLRSVVWDGSWSKETLSVASAKMVGAARFSYYMLSKPEVEFQARELRDAFERPQEEYRRLLSAHMSNGSGSVISGESGQAKSTSTTTATSAITATTATLYNFGPLKELHLVLDMDLALYAGLQYPYPNTLTKLVMTILVSDNGFIMLGLESILQSWCPLLEFLEIHGTPHVGLSWEHFPTTIDDQGQQKQQQQPLALRTLILENIALDQDSLENILTFTLQLKALKLIGMPSSNDVRGYDWLRLFRHLQSLPIALETIHCSTQNQQSSPEVLKAMSEICPTSSTTSEWNLWALDTSRTLLKDLELHTGNNSLTTLKLFSRATRSRASCLLREFKEAPLFLHELLTKSDKLVHLKTLKTIVRLEDWDIYRRAGNFLLDDPNLIKSNNDKTNSNKPIYGNNLIDGYQANMTASLYRNRPEIPSPVVWRCRGLQTLHIEVHASSEFMANSQVQSRIIFGYISRVFRQLEELRVRTPHFFHTTRASHDIQCPNIRLELESGLCLLGRLRHLQRLDVRPMNNAAWSINNLKEVDLDWMIPSGQNYKTRWTRRKEVKQWKQQRLEEKKLEAYGLHERTAATTYSTGVIGNVSARTEVLGQLRNLGLLKDVKEMIKEMESMSVPPLPSLEGLSLRHPYFVWPEKEIKYALEPSPAK
ncbi:hypothetical protein BGZ96_004626 [Linnemannia gamsii]|uniref:F-box domain-containing protein n=1 Tax=Linnemannia gamsii TaxID=64522 RepID=A0ABQ7K6X3_9FUNG|nr:hypothetical protein BGZ96_004626 [Linnemannia gamsii]